MLSMGMEGRRISSDRYHGRRSVSIAICEDIDAQIPASEIGGWRRSDICWGREGGFTGHSNQITSNVDLILRVTVRTELWSPMSRPDQHCSSGQDESDQSGPRADGEIG